MSERLAAVVLVGGRSRRLGQDKAQLVVDGVPVLTRILSAVRPLVRDVCLVGGKVPPQAPGTRWMPDAMTGAGPLGGLVAGFEALDAEWCFALACDTPFLSTALLTCLRDAIPTGAEVDAVVPRLQAGLEPLVALYSHAARPRLRDALDRGERALHRILGRLRVCEVGEETLRGADAELRGFLNVNTPADLAHVESLARAESAVREVKLTLGRGSDTLVDNTRHV